MTRGDTHSARTVAWRLVLGAALLALTGCLTHAPAPAPSAAPWISAGESLEGRAILYSVHGDGPLTVLLLASIHGDEECGTPLLERLHATLAVGDWSELLVGRRLVIVPVANPDGHAAGRRTNARGVDLNRNFPSENFRAATRHGVEPLSEPESRALFDLIERHDPARVLSFHMAADRIDFDGPAEDLARHVAAHSPLEVAPMGSRPGSLGSYVGLDRQCPILTIELPASTRDLTDDQAWHLYAPLLRAAVAY